MGMDLSSGSAKKARRQTPRPSMNVTPLVDVVLVLLIIFMVITPLMTKQVWARVPLKDDPAQAPPPADAKSEPPVVLTLGRDGHLRVNREIIPVEALSERLTRIFAARADAVLFFDAEDDVPWDSAMQAIDRARGSVKTVAVLTEAVDAPANGATVTRP